MKCVIGCITIGVFALQGAVVAHADSLWSGSTIAQSSFFADKPVAARSINDIVFIMVDESTMANTDTGLDFESESNMGGTVSNWFGIEGWSDILDILKGDSVFLKTKKNDTTNLPAWKTDVDNEFEGEGSTSRTNSVKTKIAATIIEINPNGNMVLEARRNVQVNKENCQILLTGIARPDDIDASNEVESAKIADLRVSIVGQGDVSRYSEPGLLTKVMALIR